MVANPLRTKPAPLPTSRSPLIGRERELADVCRLVCDSAIPLLTLTGPGGVGKTRLALAAAQSVEETFRSGVIFVQLAPLRDHTLVLPAIAQALGVRGTAKQSPADEIQNTIGDRLMLLVLDNVEHVVEAAVELGPILRECLHLTIMTTSRAVLHLTDEQLYPVPPLAIPGPTQLAASEIAASDAGMLFATRARAARPEFAITEENASAVAEICRRLDGLPLAIELAAARSAVLDPTALLVRLEQRLPTLTGGPRDMPARQQTMRQTIAWSYDLLTPDEQQLFQRLAVFDGRFRLDAVAAVCYPDGSLDDALAGVTALVNKSLLRQTDSQNGEARFVMLETVREYGKEQLHASGEEPAIRHAHACHFVALAERIWDTWTEPPYRGPDRLADVEGQIRRMKPELGNIRAALTWTIGHAPADSVRLAGALDWYWSRLGLIAEGREWIERCIVAAARAPNADRARALMVAGWLALQQVDLEKADAWLTESVALYRAQGNHARLAEALSRLGNVAQAQGNLVRARQLHEEEHTESLQSQDPILAVIATANLGVVAAAMGDLAKAETLLEEAVAGHRTTSGPYPTAIALGSLGNVVLKRGDVASAAGHYREALATFVDGGDWADIARCMEGLAVATVGGWPASSVQLLGAIASLRVRIDSVRAPEDESTIEQTLGTARSALDPTTYAHAWATGQQQPIDDVIAEALALATVAATEPAIDFNGQGHHHGLTHREQEVLCLVTRSYSNREIAEALFISVPTVKRHLTTIFGKLGVSSRLAASAYAHDYRIA